MTRAELDIMWQKALHESVAAGEQFTRYHFAALVAAQVVEETIERGFVSNAYANHYREVMK